MACSSIIRIGILIMSNNEVNLESYFGKNPHEQCVFSFAINCAKTRGNEQPILIKIQYHRHIAISVELNFEITMLQMFYSQLCDLRDMPSNVAMLDDVDNAFKFIIERHNHDASFFQILCDMHVPNMPACQKEPNGGFDHHHVEELRQLAGIGTRIVIAGTFIHVEELQKFMNSALFKY